MRTASIVASSRPQQTNRRGESAGSWGRAARLAWSLLARSLCVAWGVGCGGGDNADAFDNDTVIPLEWSAGERIASFTAFRVARDAQTLSGPSCAVSLELAESMSAGAVSRTDEEGACIVTDAAMALIDQPDFAPLDGGTVDLQVGGITETLTLSADRIAAPTPYDCAQLESRPSVVVTSFGNESPDDVLGEGTVDIQLAAYPMIAEPEPIGSGMAQWPEGELRVRWRGSAGASVEIVLADRDFPGTAVRCFIADDGEFVFPERLIAPYRARPVTLEVARVNHAVQTLDGVEVRLNSRASEGLWIVPNVR